MAAKKLVFAGEINSTLVEKVWRGNWSELILCSDGGCTYCMRAICDYLLDKEKKVIGVGQIMSSATAILACGTPALCSPNCRFLVHASDLSEASGGIQEMRNNAEELKVEENWYLDVLEARTNLSRLEWKDLIREETVFSAAMAKTIGLVDAIL